MRSAVASFLLLLGVLQADRPWQDLFVKEDWYKGAEGKEQVFAGKLVAIPNDGGATTFQRTSHYRLGDRNLYTGSRKHTVLDKLVGKTVEIQGKAVDFELEGRNVREIWPAAIREREVKK